MRPPWDVTGAVVAGSGGLSRRSCTISTKDWTQYDNVAAKNPDKLKELEDLFWVEANKYQVLPLDASFGDPRWSRRGPSLTAGRTQFTWSGEITGTPNGDAPIDPQRARTPSGPRVEVPHGRAPTG